MLAVVEAPSLQRVGACDTSSLVQARTHVRHGDHF
jgi:hypothetical protein